ncbi:hypothetical protein SANA_31210 [Gottschalkiaceae bacterium SANA]|nr:hypothetical protein SANA_31210 [Gottschalkiaceae bacterium SANA]
MMKRQLGKWTTLAVILILLVNLMSPAFAAESTVDINSYRLGNELDYLIKYILNNTVDDTLTKEELITAAKNGIFEAVDQHSHYYDTEEFNELNASTSGNFGGVGAYVEFKEGFYYVTGFTDVSPAKESGLRVGDKIVVVNGKALEGLASSEALNYIRGKVGSNARIGITRGNTDRVQYYDMVRELIKSNPITVMMPDENEQLDADMAYVRITQFNANLLSNMQVTFKELKEAKIKKVIFDLRGNPGGYLDQVLEVLKMIVVNDDLLHVQYKDNAKNFRSELQVAPFEIAVLVNGDSASASEIFAGAIQDTNSGIIIGDQTYGKGSVQGIFPLTNKEGFKMTIAEYFTPDWHKVNGVGITPDIIIPQTLPMEKLLSDFPMANEQSTLKYLQKSKTIQTVKAQLAYLGYEVDPSDDLFNQELAYVLPQFQRDFRINLSYRLDPETQATLNALTTGNNAYYRYLAKNLYEDDAFARAIEELRK